MFRRVLLAVGIGLIACTTGRLSVDPVAISVARPSQVAMYIAVSEGDKPLTDLTASSFTLYEDGNALDSSQVKLTLLDRDRAAAHRTLILVDASAKLGDREKPLERGVAAMVKTIRGRQPVSVYSFSGADKIKKLAVLEPGGGDGNEDPLSEMAAGSGDASRDLNGAIVEGLDQLEADLAGSDKPVRIGTLVLIASGPDLAGRVPPEQLNARLNATHHNVVAVGVSDKVGALERIGKDGVWYTATADKLTETLEQVATKVDGLYRSRYLLAYCSPARAGERRLRVEVSKPDERGRPIASNFETRFDASGFGAGCDPSATPPFVVALVAGGYGGWLPAALPEAGAPEPEADAGDGGAAEESEGEKPEEPATKGPKKPSRGRHRPPRPSRARKSRALQLLRQNPVQHRRRKRPHPLPPNPNPRPRVKNRRQASSSRSDRAPARAGRPVRGRNAPDNFLQYNRAETLDACAGRFASCPAWTSRACIPKTPPGAGKRAARSEKPPAKPAFSI